MHTDILDTDSLWLGKGNFGFAKYAETGNAHDKGNMTAYDRARRRVFVVGHVWGDATGARAEASVRCLQANGGPKQQGVAEVESGSKNAAVTLNIGPLFALTLAVMMLFRW